MLTVQVGLATVDNQYFLDRKADNDRRSAEHAHS